MSIRTRKARSFKFQRSLIILLLLLGLATSSGLEACPALLLAEQLTFARPASLKRSQLQLFVYQSRPPSLRSLALQIDPLDKENNLEFPEELDWMEKNLSPNDRLSFHAEGFGEPFHGQLDAPCLNAEWLELRAQGKYAYLLACPQGSKPAELHPEPVVLNESQRLVSSQFYRYQYSARNHLVFDEIKVVDRQLKDFSLTAANSDLVIIADVKKFFTLAFDAGDFDAKIIRKRSGTIGLVGGMEFFLRILAFRIEMALMPEANFFNDALFMPMTMYLPVDAKKYLRRGSGVYYSWESGREVEWLVNESEIEDLDITTIDPEAKTEPTQVSTKYCSSTLCRYSLLAQVKERRFAMHFTINRQAAELGFFPRLIRDLRPLEKLLDRPLSRFTKQRRMGIYFETARMPQGTHSWDFWIHFLDKHDSFCEIPLRVRPYSLTKVKRP